MYHYIVSTYSGDGIKFTSQKATLLKILKKYSVDGPISLATSESDIELIINQAVKEGCKTVIAIGDDAFIAGLKTVATKHRSVAIGILPLVGSFYARKLLPGSNLDKGISILARRFLSQEKVIRVNDHITFGDIVIKSPPKVSTTQPLAVIRTNKLTLKIKKFTTIRIENPFPNPLHRVVVKTFCSSVNRPLVLNNRPCSQLMFEDLIINLSEECQVSVNRQTTDLSQIAINFSDKPIKLLTSSQI